MNLLKVGLDVEEITRKKNKKAAAPPVEPAGEKHKCPQCDFVFVGEFGKEGWWCPNCKEAREYE
jgi:rubrerythrin